MAAETKFQTLHPDRSKEMPRIDRWKYDAVRKAILKAVPRKGDGLLFKELPARVKAGLAARDRERLGSVGWYTTVVKLDLEVRGELERLPGASPQRLLRKG